jgi:hypothetical protein
MSGNILVGQLTGEALCKSGYDCGICFRCELCGIEDESKDVLSINFAVASILQPGETRTFGSHILHLFTA